MSGEMVAVKATSMFVAILAVGTATTAQSAFMSAPMANTLSRLFDNTSTYAFAAPDPEQPGIVVAVVYVPGSKLFVVSARPDSPDAIARNVADRAYRDAYLELRAASTREFYVEDTGANGLLHGAGASVDVVYDGNRITRFNSAPQSQHLSPGEYDGRFAEADRRYAHALGVLIDAFRRHAPGGP